MINPSYLITSSLPDEVPSNYLDPSFLGRVWIQRHPEKIQVSYSAVEAVVRKIHQENPKVNLFIHLGVAKKDDPYRLEIMARRRAYRTPDVCGQTPTNFAAGKAGRGRVPKDVEQLRVELDLAGVRERLEKIKHENE